ncbi:CRAL-TRIO domain-containing protein [Mycena floridula]|nr:CRAL-TRIO domain-containing protein [Mycena floridula]
MSDEKTLLQPASASAAPAVIDPNYRPAPGQVGNLTVIQQHTLEKLKKELIAEGKFDEERMDDAMLLRFLRARKFDLPAAKAMLLAAEEWRKTFGVDNIIKTFNFKENTEVSKYYPQYYHKTDKDGRPIYIQRLGLLDVNALYKLTTQERQLQSLVYEYEKCFAERLPASSKVCGHPVETFCSILDLKNVSLSNFYHVKDYISQASSIGQDRYPETMGKFYIINAPFAFAAVWSLIKPWLDEVTVNKISILKSSQYKEKLLEQIAPENLPFEFGGTCQCPGGCALSDAGPWKTLQLPVSVP